MFFDLAINLNVKEEHREEGDDAWTLNLMAAQHTHNAYSLTYLELEGNNPIDQKKKETILSFEKGKYDKIN